MTDRRILFSGEMQICRWSESSTNGATVTMWVHPEDLESFKLLKARSGKHAGQRLGCVLVEISDEEAIVEQPEPTPNPAPGAAHKESPRRYHPPAIGDNGLLAVRWCKDATFQKWMSEQAHVTFSYGSKEEDCKQFILYRCGLTQKHGAAASRKHLDTDPEAAALFHQLIRIPFRDYLRERGQS